MTLLEEIAQLLHDLGVGTYTPNTAGGTIFLAALPTSPDRCMAVARYGASEADSKLPYDEISIQIRCRGSAVDARQAEQDAQNVYDALHGLENRELAGGTWLALAVGIQSGPVYIGRDQNGRHEYVVNFRAEISRSTPNRSE